MKTLKTLKTVKFTMPPPFIFCCAKCIRKGRDIRKDNEYPVIEVEKTDNLECTGGKRIHIKTDCGKVIGFSALHFS